MVNFYNLKCLCSNYHDNIKYEFYLQILDDDIVIPTGFSDGPEPCYKVKAFEGQEVNSSIIWLRKSLIGSLYVVVDIPNKFLNSYKQLTIFDFI